jgi:hypothetical protein
MSKEKEKIIKTVIGAVLIIFFAISIVYIIDVYSDIF